MMKTLMMIPFMTFILVIPVLIGVYVYRDANRRNMNAVLWTLIAILAPSLIGFIIYLLVRGNYSNMRCPQCDAIITDQYVVCPKCGTKLRPTCPNCASPIETDWKACPKCAQPLYNYSQQDYIAPVIPKDNTLWKILAVVIIVPILMLTMGLLSMSAFTSSGASSLTTFTVDQYLADMENDEIEEWLNNVGDDIDKAYVLKHQKNIGEEKRIRYLIYYPRLDELHSCSFGVKGGLFGETFKLNFYDSKGSGGNTLILATYNGDGDPRLKFYYDGKKIDCEITEVDYPIGLTDGSKYATSSIEEGLPKGAAVITQSDEVIIEP